MSETGVIKQIIGAVIDVEFDKEQIPNIYDALVVGDNQLVLETPKNYLSNQKIEKLLTNFSHHYQQIDHF